MSDTRHRLRRYGPIAAAATLILAIGLGAWFAAPLLGNPADEDAVTATTTPQRTSPATTVGASSWPTTTAVPQTTTTTTEPVLIRDRGTVPAWTVGEPWGSVSGLTMFRGNPTRTWYGSGPAPVHPSVRWRYPEDAMCSRSTTAGETTTWCGTGWTGQPVVWDRPDGTVEVIFGALDRQVHFVNAVTGTATRTPFPTGDLVKGSVTLDPDGFPLIYFGSRDNQLRIVALDRPEPAELWSLDARAVRGLWNSDWDGNPVVVDDVLYEGGENSWFFVVRLNRRIGPDGLATVDPEILVSMPGYNDELLRKVGRNVSIENSPALFEDRVYFANSGGRVVGLDTTDVHSGNAPIVFDYWVGDDVDASIVVDHDGALYIAAELERFNDRSEELGQLIKLDPDADDPYVWGVPVPADGFDAGGIWATPALRESYLYVTTNPGELLAVNTQTGEITWSDQVGWHAWSSPVIVEDLLVVATCTGEIRGYGLEDPATPSLRWSLQIPSATCVESTPAVWGGRIFVGGRDGFLYALADEEKSGR